VDGCGGPNEIQEILPISMLELASRPWDLGAQWEQSLAEILTSDVDISA
jgi:hypothetical protein